jgi:hypothetical protein
MTYLGIAVHAVRLGVLTAAAAFLAGCMIVSDAELVADSEGAQVLPAKAYLTGYDEDGANTWKVSDDGAQELTLEGNTYSSDDGSLNARFVPLENLPGKYLAALVGDDGSIYGVATFKNDILVMEVVLGDDDPVAVATAADPALAGIAAKADQGGIEVTTRDQLDGVIQLALDGKLTLLGLVLYVADSPDAEPPARIVNDNGEYRAE